MIDKQTKKKIKKISKQIKDLKKSQRKLEFRPCKNDADLRDKERELSALKKRILSLENEQDRFMLNSGAVCHGG